MKTKQLIEQLRFAAKEQGKEWLDGQCLQILLDQAADRIEEQANLIRIWSNRADELLQRDDFHYGILRAHYTSQEIQLAAMRKAFGTLPIVAEPFKTTFAEIAEEQMKFSESGRPCGGGHCQLCYFLGLKCSNDRTDDRISRCAQMRY